MLNQQGTATISQHSYTLDAVGNRTQLNETLAQVGGGQPVTVNTTYGYDALSRLTADGATTYSYDPVGNRLTKGSATSSYDRADRLTSAAGAAVTVDAAGNTTANGAARYYYDQADRLTGYTYNGDGLRVGAGNGTTSATSYVYDVATSLPVLLSDGTNKYVYGAGLAYTVDSSGAARVSHQDRLGSVRTITHRTSAPPVWPLSQGKGLS